MKGFFWNSNGLRDQAKPGFLFDSTSEHQLHFISLLETKKKDFNSQELSHFCAKKNFQWSWATPKGRFGGILVGVSMEKFDVQNIVQGDF
jgi:hypothetical protein